MKRQKINIVRKTGQNYSYFVDENGLLKGEWGGFDENPYLVHGKRFFWIYYSKFSKRVPIDEYGYFYFKFHCSKYDGVLELSDGIFLCEKDERFGVIDGDGNYIFHTAFRKVSYIKREIQDEILDLFIIKSETRMFLYNNTTKSESKEYDEITYYSNEYFLYKENGKFGLIDNNGKILTNAIYNKRNYCDSYRHLLYTDLLGYGFPIYFTNNKIYGKITLNKYEKCVKVGPVWDSYYYITLLNEKYGLLNQYGETIVDPCMDEVYLYDGPMKPYIEIKFSDGKSGKWVNIIFVITKQDGKFSLYDVVSGKCIVSECEEMDFVVGPKRIGIKESDFIRFKKNSSVGYVTTGGFIIDKNHFDEFHLVNSFWLVSQNGKWGVLRLTGFEYYPCIFDNIKHIRSGLFLVHENGIEKTIGKDYESVLDVEPYYYSNREMMQDTWDAMTDGQYGDMPDGFNGDFDFLGY